MSDELSKLAFLIVSCDDIKTWLREGPYLGQKLVHKSPVGLETQITKHIKSENFLRVENFRNFGQYCLNTITNCTYFNANFSIDIGGNLRVSKVCWSRISWNTTNYGFCGYNEKKVYCNIEGDFIGNDANQYCTENNTCSHENDNSENSKLYSYESAANSCKISEQKPIYCSPERLLINDCAAFKQIPFFLIQPKQELGPLKKSGIAQHST